MRKFDYLWFRNVLLLSAGMMSLCLPPINAAYSPFSAPITQQAPTKKQVSGVVVDNANEPLIGATVQDKKSGNSTITNVDGQFTLSVTEDAVLTVSFIGYKSKQITVDGKTNLKIMLEDGSEKIDEVVVVGYGVQKKINLSGAVDQISSKQLEQRPITDLARGLQGMIPNLNVDFTSGEPGQAPEINIRGVASINGGSPLILIDGVASDVSEMNRLLTEDIESISVLKDASSAAIYGARASFGVILITTKQGKGDRIQVSYNNDFSWKRPSSLTNKTSDPYIYLKLKNIAVLNTPWSSGQVTSDEKLEWARQRSDNPSGTEAIRLNPLDETQWDYMGNKNWTNSFLDKYTFSNSHQISVSGATAKTNFYFSGGMDNEDGVFSNIVKNDKYIRASMRSKVSYKIWDWMTFSNNTSFVSTTRKKPSYYNLNSFYNAEPDNMDVNTDGTWANDNLGVALAQLVDGGEAKTVYDRLQSTFSAEMNFWKKMLMVNANFTFAKGNQNYDWYTTTYRVGYGPKDVRELGTSEAYKSNTSELYTVLDLYATFNKLFANKHSVTGILGFNQEYNRSDEFSASRNNIISTSLPSIALASGDQYVGETYTDWAIRGLFFRTNYTYDNRYIFEINGRYDGTSRFPKKKRFGFFPSGSVAWRIDSEPFFKPLLSVFSYLKLRASYGSLGNQLVSEYGYIPSMSSQLGSYLIGGALQQTVTSPALVSSDYSWEKVKTLNGGIDMNFFNNKLTVTYDIYRRNTEGMLTSGKELPAVLGASVPIENAANLKTDGWELSVAYKDAFLLKGKPFNWGARFVLSDSRSWITKFDNSAKTLGEYYVGEELGEIWGLHNDGMFKSKQEIAALDETQIIPWGALSIVEGWPKYKDLDGDHQITKGTTVDKPGDLRKIGNSSARYRYGFNLNMEWNGFDVSAFLQGIGKRDYYPLSYLYWSFYQQPYAGGQVSAFDFYRSTTDNSTEMAKESKSYIKAGLANQNLNSKYPVLQCWLADKNLGTGINAMGLAIPQTAYLLNGAYLRIKNITVGYTLPSEWTQKAHLTRVRLYVSGDNIFEWSALKKYFDPEAVTNQDSYGYVYPFNRQYSIGMNVTF
jgi:TonB-linked SusC/RagA family outer membrane protein